MEGRVGGRRAKLTTRTVRAAEPGAKRVVINDTELPGFRLVVSPAGKKGFYYRYRVGGGRAATIREPKIGDFGPITVEQARAIAEAWAAEVRMGGDPSGRRQDARVAPTMEALFDRYVAEHARPHKKPSSVAEDERLIARYLLPAFAKRKVAEVARTDVAKFHAGMTSTPYAANRCLALLSKTFNLAEVWGLRPDASNPCRHVRKYREEARKRFLTPAELGRLGEALKAAERGEVRVTSARRKGAGSAVSPQAIAAIRLLLFTGARKSEILGLKWEWINFEAGRADLPDSKTGFKALALNAPALAVLNGLPRVEGNPYVIPGGRPGAHLENLKDPWGAIREAAGLEDVHLHDLRHSFAAVGAGGGESLHIVGGLLGHNQPATTKRYAHLADDPLKAAAERIGEKIAEALEGKDVRG